MVLPKAFPIFDRLFFPGHVQILMYHGFTENGSDDQPCNEHGKHMFIGTFESQIQYLKEHHTVISLDQMLAHLRERTRLPPKPVVLTMDDGYASNYHLAFPVLKRHHVPATVFVTTEFLDRRMFFISDRIEYSVCHSPLHSGMPSEEKQRMVASIRLSISGQPGLYRLSQVERVERDLSAALSFANTPPLFAPLSWEQCREMSASGLVTIGSHTLTHPSLTECAGDELDRELTLSRRRIEEMLQKPCPFFCYPYGATKDWSPSTEKALERAGYSLGLTTVPGQNTRRSNPLALKRLGTSNEMGPDDFTRLLSPSYRGLRRQYKKLYRSYTAAKTALNMPRTP